MEKVLSLSVHQLVDFLLRTGDIDNRVYNKTTMSEGTKIHSFHQSQQGGNYIAEFFLKETFYVSDFVINLEGRADGVIIKEDKVIIDEIKSTISPLEDYYDSQKDWHLGQAKCYALMYAHLYHLDKIGIQLTYIHQIENTKMIKHFTYKVSALEKYVEDLMEDYLEFYRYIFERIEKRNASAKNLKFPFPKFRAGQKELSKYAYGIAKSGGILFAEAPTGIGKTMSTLYPFAKSFADEENEKIFYLTAKNSGRLTAYEATKLLIENGLCASAIMITAKDKVCMCPGKGCNPDECPFAKDYYTNIRKVIIESAKQYQLFSPEVIKEIAEHYAICPFELSLDLSLFVDIIICDYNYLFDPMVYLKRYFDEDASNMIALIDESHNLVDRGREMYSASIDSYSFKQAKKAVRYLEHKKIKNAIKRISKMFNRYDDLPEGDHIISFLEDTDVAGINAYLLASSDVNKHHHAAVTEEFTDFFFELNKFSKIYEQYDSSFVLYVTKTASQETKITLYCLDPRSHLKAALNKVKSKIVFSATLSPSQYYIDLLGGTKNDPLLRLPSPFIKENLDVLVAPTVSIRYKNRQETIQEVVDYALALIEGHVGNYFIYVPSYEYLENLVPYLKDKNLNIIVQERDMSEIDKAQFLSCFVDKPKETTVGVAVVGGAFGEGIDLVADRLIGVIVIGVGLPQVCFERNLIRNYFDEQYGKGYSYAYINPGINKVMQAVGRVIRSEKDRGVALLIDDRYLSNTYQDLFANEWPHYKVVTSIQDVKEEVDNFWNKK